MVIDGQNQSAFEHENAGKGLKIEIKHVKTTRNGENKQNYIYGANLNNSRSKKDRDRRLNIIKRTKDNML